MHVKFYGKRRQGNLPASLCPCNMIGLTICDFWLVGVVLIIEV